MLNVIRGHIYWSTGNTLAGAIVGTKTIDTCLFVYAVVNLIYIWVMIGDYLTFTKL